MSDEQADSVAQPDDDHLVAGAAAGSGTAGAAFDDAAAGTKPVAAERVSGAPGAATEPANSTGTAASRSASTPTPSAISGAAVRAGDRVFKGLAAGAGGLLLLIMVAIAVFLVWRAWPALFAGDGNKGNLLTTERWTFPETGVPTFGIAAMAFGTMVSAVIAMVIGVPIAIGIALFITQYAPRRLATALGAVVDLLAAVPSLVFGMWGLYLLIPKTQGFQSWLNDYFSWTYIFDNTRFTNPNQYGQSLLMAGIVLSIMILPTVSAVSREVFRQTPQETVDAAWALGATKWEAIRTAVLPFGRAGMISAAMLGLGRALGETIAVALVLNSAFRINGHLTEKAGDTFASTIALKFGEAANNPLGIPALITAGLFLFVITLIVNSIARAIIARKKEFTA